MKRKVALVVNPVAGNGLALSVASTLAELLRGHDLLFTVYTENWPQDYTDHTDVWVIGGDGTLNRFINTYPDLKLPLMIFKGGTGNDFHWILYKDITVERQLEVALANKPRWIDAGTCNGKLFLNGLGVGFDGSVAAMLLGKKKKPGKATYMVTVLKKIFTYKERTFTISANGIESRSRLLMVNVMNGQRTGGGFYVTPDALLDDGELQANIVQPLSILKRLFFLPVIEKGNHTQLPFIKYFAVKSMQIRCDLEVDAHLDGEYLKAKQFDIRILPSHFQFIY